MSTTCIRCGDDGYPLMVLETDVRTDLVNTNVQACGSCTTVLWDWLQDNVTPIWIMGSSPDVPHHLLKGAFRLRIWSQADRPGRQPYTWFISHQDSDRVLDFLTRPN